MTQSSRRFVRTIAEIGAVAFTSSLLTFLVPMVVGKTEDPQRVQARTECERIGAALRQFVSDTGALPREAEVSDPQVLHWLRSGGRMSPRNPFADGPGGELRTFLSEEPASGAPSAEASAPSPSDRGWKGPYMLSAEPDPWGNAYVVNVHALDGATEVAWVLSPGPDGIIDTPAGSSKLEGDDVGVAME